MLDVLTSARLVRLCRCGAYGARLYRPALWHTIGTLAAPKCHQAPRLRTTKSLCLHVVGCACWCDAWTFNPLVDGSIPSRPDESARPRWGVRGGSRRALTS